MNRDWGPGNPVWEDLEEEQRIFQWNATYRKALQKALQGRPDWPEHCQRAYAQGVADAIVRGKQVTC